MEVQGLNHCPRWLRLAYFKSVGFCCEDCGLVFTEKELEVHRITQGYKGGFYNPSNCKILCGDCHKRYNEEW